MLKDFIFFVSTKIKFTHKRKASEYNIVNDKLFQLLPIKIQEAM